MFTRREAAVVRLHKRKKTTYNAGETIVEVVASIFIFLLLMGIMQGAISYSTASLGKNKEIRQNNTAILQGLTGTQVTDKTSKTISFYAVGNDGTVGKKVFEVETELGKKKVTYTDTKGNVQNIVFSLYDSPQGTDSGTGGDTP